MRDVKVRDLAHAAGVPTPELLAKLRSLGLMVADSSSRVPISAVRALVAAHPRSQEVRNFTWLLLTFLAVALIAAVTVGLTLAY